MAKNVCTYGMNYPKEKIVELIETFGLHIDYDQWDIKDKGWFRIDFPKCPEAGNLILHKLHLEVEVHQEREHINKVFQKFLMRIGEIQFKKKLGALMDLDRSNLDD